MSRWPLVLVVWLLLAAVAQAEDRNAAPEPSTLLLDNERVRVTELRINPGAKLSLEGHTFQFIYMLTAGSLVFTPPGKMPFELTLEAGEVSMLPSQSASTENDGEKEVRALIVEIKEKSQTTSSSKGHRKRSSKH